MRKEAKLHKSPNARKWTAWLGSQPSELQVCCPGLIPLALPLDSPALAGATLSSVLSLHSIWRVFCHMQPLACFPHQVIQIPFAIPSTSPWPLSPRTSFPISLPDAASRPFQIFLCPRTKAAQMWGELALGTLTAPSSCPSGMVVVSLGDQRPKKGGEKKKEKKG